MHYSFSNSLYNDSQQQEPCRVIHNIYNWTHRQVNVHLLTYKYNFSDLKISQTDALRHAGCLSVLPAIVRVHL